MGKSTSGPDWMDVESYLRAIDITHGGKSGVLISPHGTGATGGLQIDIVTTFDVLPGSSEVDGVTSTSYWPCRDCSTLEMHVFGGCHKHDFAINQKYTNMDLPF